MRTLRTTEIEPASWPVVSGLSADAGAIPEAIIWRRLEAWIAWRWPARSVEWIVEGPGEWTPTLRPVSALSAELWTAGAWEAVTLEATPLGGFRLDAEGPYRIGGTAGDDTDPPESVLEAFRRLAEYSAQARAELNNAGAALAASDVSEGDFSMTRSPNWIARAIHLSGAADLLRPYRRLGA